MEERRLEMVPAGGVVSCRKVSLKKKKPVFGYFKFEYSNNTLALQDFQYRQGANKRDACRLWFGSQTGKHW